jgi:hypothetical protein
VPVVVEGDVGSDDAGIAIVSVSVSAVVATVTVFAAMDGEPLAVASIDVSNNPVPISVVY